MRDEGWRWQGGVYLLNISMEVRHPSSLSPIVNCSCHYFGPNLLTRNPFCPLGPAPRRTEEEQRQAQAGALDPKEEVETDRRG